MQNLIHVGRTRKTYGVKGELKIEVKDLYYDDILKTEVVFVEISGKKIPYFIDTIKSKNNLLIKFQDIDNPETASLITSKKIYLRQEDLNPEIADSPNLDAFSLEDLIGFKIKDSTIGLVGAINEIEEYPQQLIAFVAYKDRTCMIPLTAGLITSIDQEAKIIEMDLPEGLLEL